MGQMMVALYWCCFALVFYAYFGYWLWLRVSAQKRPVQAGAVLPRVSIVMAVRNEAERLVAKLANLRALDYPASLLELCVVSDGSTDGTAAMLQADAQVRAIVLEQSGGKAAALNRAVEQASGELLLFLDARQMLAPDALHRLVAPFADPTVGAVSGELLLETSDGQPSADMLGLYWKIEKSIRRLESESGSVVGVTGAIYLMRRELFQPLPAGLILDDVLVPMQVARQGRRVLFQPAAIARDFIFVQPGKEFGRKVRTLAGNLQLVRLAPWLLTTRNPLLFRFVSHKLSRLAVPWLLLLMLVLAAGSGSPLLHGMLGLQLLLFLLAGVGWVWPTTRQWRPISICWTFVMLNVAAGWALCQFLRGAAVWQ